MSVSDLFLRACSWSASSDSGIGGPDFVGAAIALGIASEFWAPFKTYFEDRIKAARKGLEQVLENYMTLQRLDKAYHEKWKSEVKKRSEEVHRKNESFSRKLERGRKYATWSTFFIGFLLLYLGISCPLNGFLLAPMAVYAFASFARSKWLVYKTNKEEKYWNTQAGKFASGADLEPSSFNISAEPVDVQDSSKSDRDSTSNSNGPQS